MENFLGGRYNRPYELYRTLLPQILVPLGLEGVKVVWSQKAGCSCGCSPAFILQTDGHYDIFVTVSREEGEK